MQKFSLKQLLFAYAGIVVLLAPLGMAGKKDYERRQKLIQFENIRKNLEQKNPSVEEIKNFVLLTKKLEREFVFKEKYFFLAHAIRVYITVMGWITIIVVLFVFVAKFILELDRNFLNKKLS